MRTLISLFNYRIVIVLILSFTSFNLNAAVAESIDTIRQSTRLKPVLTYSHGWVMPTNVFVKGENRFNRPIRLHRSYSFELTKQTTGTQLWEHIYNLPRYGAGINIAQFPDASYLGVPVSIYSSLTVPLKKWNRISLVSDIFLGFAFNWNTGKEDPYNIAIGAPVTLYFNEGISIEYKASNGLMVSTGASLTHYSNGSLKLPNRGINTISPKISIGYNFTETGLNLKKDVIPDFQKQNMCYFSVFGAVRNEYYYGDDVDSLTKYKGVYFGAYGVSFSLERQISYKSIVGIGIMADYFGMAKSTVNVVNGRLVPVPGSLKDGLQISLIPSYELVINKISIIVQHGFYIHRAYYTFRNPVGYQRAGLKYTFGNNLSLGASMRLHDYGIADFIEWTIGYKLNL